MHLRTGVTCTATLLLKDLSGRTALPIFQPGGDGAGDMVMVADPATLPCAALGTAQRLDSVRPVSHRRHAAPVFHARLAAPHAGTPCRAWLHLARRAGGGVPSAADTPIGMPAAGPHHDAGAAAAGDAAEPRLPIFDRAALRRARPAAGKATLGSARSWAAAALAGNRDRAVPDRGHARRHDRHGASRPDAAVPQRDQADLRARRLSGELHVPAAFAACGVLRLAPASFDRGRRDRPQCVSGPGGSVAPGPGVAGRPAAPCGGSGGVQHADDQRLQALSAELHGAGSCRVGL